MHETPLWWAAEPTHVRIFFLYLFAVTCILLVRSLRLGRRLYSMSTRKQISIENIGDGVVSPEMLAESALANGTLYHGPTEESRNRDITSPTARQDTALRTMEAASSRFLYLWEMCNAEVESIKRMLLLTLLLSALVVVYGAFPTWADEFNNGTITGSRALVVTMDKLLARFALGLSICVILYAVSSFFEGLIKRRLARWKYISTRWKSELAGL